jgi:hypothetical protein
VIVTISTVPTGRVDGGLQRAEIGVEAAVEAHHQRRAGLLHDLEAVRTRDRLRSTGFSQNTALPARAKRSIRSAWVSVGVQITTASMSPRLDLVDRADVAAPGVATRRAAAATGSATATSRAPGTEATARAWTCPMRPAPSTPNLRS